MGNCSSSRRHDEPIGTTSEEPLNVYDPVRYKPGVFEICDPTSLVIKVHFVAESVLQNGGNHWIICLQTPDQAVVRLNMSPTDVRGARVSGHGYRGQIEITYGEDDAMTRNDSTQEKHHCLVTVPATPDQTVANFILAIMDAGNHEYDFTTEGRGCTGWIIDQYRLFDQLDLIQPGFDAIETAIALEWVNGRPTDQSTITRGFYMRDTRGGGWGRGVGRGCDESR
ncbi:hypothetical protein QBC46DRAFT_307500 [Diplogelasinospora grovesii]|uniref:DUF7770 domain-containing protein n=1 Tax=Diplogelasinospora grovesii TaxID=303347 RepID=A0AAN6S7L0_9PEZI|nr:hypothetical protein QBC46DRAFT_307500 [Diplogelasinospora grovesii]